MKIEQTTTDAFALSEGIGLSSPLVSIIMPLYNAEKYVAEAIESVLAQTYTHWELIIVNDGSTDNSLEETYKVLENLIGFEREKIRVYTQENKGQCAANNYGFQFAKGEYIKFFDADDLISKDMLENQVKMVNGKEDILVSATWGRFYRDDKSDFKIVQEQVNQDLEPINWLTTSWRKAQPMMQCALWLIPRKILLKSGIWDERLGLINDFEFFARVLLHSKKVLFCQHAILYYRSGIGNSLSRQKSRKAIDSAFLSLELGTSYLLQAQNNTLTRLCSANMWQGFVYEYYYQQPDLAQKAEAKIKELGGSDIPFPCGGYTKLLARVLGWKLASKIKYILKKL